MSSSVPRRCAVRASRPSSLQSQNQLSTRDAASALRALLCVIIGCAVLYLSAGGRAVSAAGSGADATGVDFAASVPPPAPSVVYVDDDWTGLAAGTDPDGVGPATAIGYDAFATIQGGVDGVAAGGTVNVAAGTYGEQPVVGKSLVLHGAGAGATNITAPASPATRFNNFFILFEVNGGASVEASGITVKGPINLNGCRQATPFSTFRRYYGVYVRGGASLNLHDSSVLDIRENNPAAGTNCQVGTAVDAGTSVAALNQTGTLTLANTTITGFQARGVTVDNAGSSATITGNTLTGSTSPNFSQSIILVAIGATANISGNQITGAQCSDATNCGPDTFNQSAAVGISLTAPAAGTQITNNTISGNDYGVNSVTAPNVTPAISGNTFGSNRYFGVNISDGNATLTGNTFSGASNVAVVAVSVNDPANQTAADTAVTFTGNTITGAGVALQLLDDPNNPADGFFPRITAHFNRIVAATTAIDNPQNQLSDMENNWWGCNAGPGHAGCGAVTGVGADFNPWLVLAASAAPSSISPGGTSTVSADMTHNSDGAAPAGTLPDAPVAFSATNGTMLPTSATVHLGAASSTFTSTGAASATATATVDNQSADAQITVNVVSFAVGGQVTRASGGAPLAGVTLTLGKPDNTTATTTSGADGRYSFGALPAGSYTVTPSKTNYSFTPASRNVALSGADATGVDFTATSTAASSGANGTILISEFRLQGPTSSSPAPGNTAGELDEFVELYNNANTPVDVSGYTLDTSTGFTIAIPSGAVIPARGHYLLANSVGYSLSDYGGKGGATPDLTYTGFDLPPATGLALLNASGQIVDAVGFTGTPAPYFEGTVLTPVSASAECSFARDISSGVPRDDGDNATDFMLVCTDSSLVAGSRLGAPGPENRFSPVQRGAQIVSRLVAAVPDSSAPNRTRDASSYTDTLTPSSPNGGAPASNPYGLGTLSVQRRFVNQTGAAVTRLRFRVVSITGLNSPYLGLGTPQADVRLLTSNGAARAPGGFTFRGLTLEQSPSQTLGGGWNSTVAVDLSVLPGGNLGAGQSVDVQFLLGVAGSGKFAFFVIVEGLP
ncbi:MAG: lamin tail domain-containing protein [Pyrinomonadaceae bacterium]